MLARALPVLMLVVGCGSTSGPDGPGAKTPPSAGAPSFPDTARCEGASALRPLSDGGQSSSITLGAFAKGPLAGKTIAFVADEDGAAVASVDVDGKKALGAVALGAPAAQLLVLPDGRLLATLRDADRVAVLGVSEAGVPSVLCTRPTSAEPIAMAVRPGGGVFVSAGWGARLDHLDATFTRKASIELPRDPRQVVVSDDGRTAFVSHAVGGTISVVDVEKGRAVTPIPLFADPSQPDDEVAPRSLASAVGAAVGKGAPLVPGEGGVRVGLQGYAMVKTVQPAGRLLLPQVLVDPGQPGSRSEGFGVATPTTVPNIAVIDAVARVPLRTSMSASQTSLILESIADSRFDGQPTAGGCLLPRGAAVDPSSGSLLVACLGSDIVIAYDGASASPATVEAKRWDVGSGPVGVAIDPDKRLAVSWSQFERSLDVLRLDDIGVVVEPDGRPRRNKIDLPALKNPPALAFLLGRQIFHAVSDVRLSSEGLACASCHIDGRDDGLSWVTAEGPRRTAVLAGRMEPPFGWTGASEDMARYLDLEFQRLHGQGLRSVQREALLAYLSALRTPPPRETDAALADKGKAVFAAKGCAACHPGGGTDGKAHDVGSKRGSDKKAAFDTPSLRHLAGRAPYFHDGRFATIRELLEQPHAEKGAGPKLTTAEIAALEAYLTGL